MTSNSQLIGRVLSVQKILVGGTEQTPEGSITDGKVTPYMLIRGSTGNDAIVDADGNLVCMLKGSENLPIAQDASGNMVAVVKGSEDLIIAQDTSGNMIAAMKGMEGVNVRDVAVDPSGQMITILKGADGDNVAVDGSGNLSAAMKGLEGANVRDIAVDASGNMIAVMKGDYGGDLKTWKVDDVGRGEMFLNDPSDVWGNVNTMGLGEAMVRTHAPPMVHDKRGTLVRWIDFESATPNYDVSVVGTPTYTRSEDTSFHGDFSHKSALANGESVELHQVTNDYDETNLRGISAMFATADSDLYIELELCNYFGTATGMCARVKVRYDLASGDLSVYAIGGWTVIDNLEYYHNIYNFSTIKLIGNFLWSRYTRVTIFGEEYDLSAYGISIVTGLKEHHLDTIVRVTGTAAGTNTIYLDNILMTENEPGN